MYNEMLKLNQIWIDQFTNNQLMAIDLPNDGLPPNPPSKVCRPPRKVFLIAFLIISVGIT